MPLSSTQRSAVTQFVSFTQADKKTAEKILKSFNWNVEGAIEEYFSNPTHASNSNATALQLSKLFDKYRDDPQANPDTIFTQGAMAYFQEVNISVEDIGVLVVSELLGCPTLGEITRAGFVSGWQMTGAVTIPTQKTFLATAVRELPSPASLEAGSRFRRVYKHTFKLACPAGAKSVPLEMAVEYWKILFSAQGMLWEPPRTKTPWFRWWLSFLEERWKKAVNKDLWEQTLLFAFKCMEDESLAWWSEESAWPGIIDEFVRWVRQKREADSAGTTDAMEVE